MLSTTLQLLRKRSAYCDFINNAYEIGIIV